MIRVINLLVLVAVAIVVVLFALANRAPATISLDPFYPDAPAWTVSAPTWVVLLATLALGVVLGGVAAWLVQGKHRRLERVYKREARDLRSEMERAREKEAATGLPALTAPVGTSVTTR